MHHRSIAILAILCFAFGGAGCESLFGNTKPKSSTKKKKKHYQEAVMPLQTGSTLQRRTYVEQEPETEPKKKPKKKEPSAPKPEAEPAETPPAPEEESTPPPDRFR